MAKIFISHTSANDDWADWIGHELEALGCEVVVDHWEKVGDIADWMYKKMDASDRVLCICSEAYFLATYSMWELTSAHWASVSEKKDLLLPVFIEPCTPPRLLGSVNRRELHGLAESAARETLRNFVAPSGKPASASFPPSKKASAFPSPRPPAKTNIPIPEPEHFLGRDKALEDIAKTLARENSRAVITALHGLRGVGKSTLAAVYAHRARRTYRATWWIAAQTLETLRADLVGLGVALDRVDKNAKEEEAVRTVLEKLRDEGEGVLLIFDNANSADEIRPYLPKGGGAKILVTSNDHNWRAIAAPVEIDVWPKDIGAQFLMERTGREERETALALSEALGGLPLAHEQAGAWCARLGRSFSDYLSRFEAAPAKLLDTEKDASPDYHNRLTVSKTFSLAIDAAAKQHPLAAPLIEHAALLAPEPIPLFLLQEICARILLPLAGEGGPRHRASKDARLSTGYGEGRMSVGAATTNEEPSPDPASPGHPLPLRGRGDAPIDPEEDLDEAVSALRAFALVDQETVEDERDATIKTETIRLHRLVRLVAGARVQGEARETALRALIQAMRAVYPYGVYTDYKTWPRARRLDALAMALVGGDAAPPKGAEAAADALLNNMACYRLAALGAFRSARPLLEKALKLAETFYPRDDPEIAVRLSNFGVLLRELGGAENFEKAREHLTRALAIGEKALGPEHPKVAVRLSNLATVLQDLGGAENLGLARKHLDRALAIDEKALGPEHPNVATDLSNLATLLQDLGGAENLWLARDHLTRALAIGEEALGPEHPSVAIRLSNLATLLQDLGGAENLEKAREHLARALAIDEKALGPEHPNVATRLWWLAVILPKVGGAENIALARGYFARAEKIFRAALGDEHPHTQNLIANRARFLAEHGEV